MKEEEEKNQKEKKNLKRRIEEEDKKAIEAKKLLLEKSAAELRAAADEHSRIAEDKNDFEEMRLELSKSNALREKANEKIAEAVNLEKALSKM